MDTLKKMKIGLSADQPITQVGEARKFARVQDDKGKWSNGATPRSVKYLGERKVELRDALATPAEDSPWGIVYSTVLDYSNVSDKELFEGSVASAAAVTLAGLFRKYGETMDKDMPSDLKGGVDMSDLAKIGPERKAGGGPVDPKAAMARNFAKLETVADIAAGLMAIGLPEDIAKKQAHVVYEARRQAAKE